FGAPILARISEIGDDRGDARGAGVLQRADEEYQPHELVIGALVRAAMGALHHINVIAGDVVERPHLVLAVLEAAFLVRGERHVQRRRQRAAEVGRGGEREQLHARSHGSMPLEILDLAFVFFGGLARVKGAEIAALAGLRVLLARIEAIAAGRELADHGAAVLRLRTAAGAFLMLAACALRIAGVGFSDSGMSRRGLARKRSPSTSTGSEPRLLNSFLASALSAIKCPSSTCACVFSTSHLTVSHEPEARRPATRSTPSGSPTS